MRRSQAMNAMAKFNVSLDEDNGNIMDAPDGYIFNWNGEHSYFIGHYNREEVKWGGVSMPYIYQEIVNVMKMGLRKCENDCSDGLRCPFKEKEQDNG